MGLPELYFPGPGWSICQPDRSHARAEGWCFRLRREAHCSTWYLAM